MTKEEFILKWLSDRAKLIADTKIAVNWEGLAAREYDKIQLPPIKANK